MKPGTNFRSSVLALKRELIFVSPCTLDKDDLPGKIDKDPEWRSTAIFGRDEVESIISDKQIAEWRRVFWSLLFLTGMRFGETAARRWRHYQPALRPLGRLVVNTSFSTYLKKEKETKTKQPRDVPVHPLLASILAGWRSVGWPALFGRAPGEDDLIVPFGDAGEEHFGKNARDQMMLRRFHADLALINRRPRRMHDARRTFISLCVTDGASKEILRWVTHSRPREDQFDDYVTFFWKPLCEQVAKLDVRLDRPGSTGGSPSFEGGSPGHNLSLGTAIGTAENLDPKNMN